MSSLFVKICTFTLAPHPNAERLNLAYPTGTEWQCCVGKELVEGELGVYIPIDSLLSPELATTLGLPSAKDDKKYRIKTIKLRGVVSQGLLVGLQSLIDKGLVPADALEPLVEDEEAVFGSLRAWQEGDDLAEALSITKYVAPEPGQGGQPGHAVHQPAGFDKYTDIENGKNFARQLVEGEEVVVTEKVHGANFRAGWIASASENTFPFEANRVFYVGSRRMCLDEGVLDNSWTRIAHKLRLADKLADMPGTIIYGELYGKGMQKLEYGRSDADLILFDVYDGKRYLSHDELVAFCEKLELPMVPILYRGPWSDAVKEYRAGPTVLGKGAHIREGVVVRPVEERWDPRLGRVLLKYISEDYLLKNYDE